MEKHGVLHCFLCFCWVERLENTKISRLFDGPGFAESLMTGYIYWDNFRDLGDSNSSNSKALKS